MTDSAAMANECHNGQDDIKNYQ
jgi:DNA repair exonuclease SbcCD ATPase subunit